MPITCGVYARIVSGSRTFSLTGWLARMGFSDTARAARMLAALGITGEEPLLATLARAADPELALYGLAEIGERTGPDCSLHETLNQDEGFRERLTAVLGVSKALADHLTRHPADIALLRGPDAERRPGAAEIRAELIAAVTSDGDPAALLAAAYHRRLLHLAARDLTGVAPFEEVTAELA